MRLSHLIEQYIAREGHTTVRALSDEFGISEYRCRQELAEIVPYGVLVSPEGCVDLCETGL